MSIASQQTKKRMPSSALNTPIIAVSMIRRQIMNSLVRFVMYFHEQSTQSGVMSVVSRISSRVMPSMPRV